MFVMIVSWVKAGSTASSGQVSPGIQIQLLEEQIGAWR